MNLLDYAIQRHAVALDALETVLRKELGDEAGAFGAELDALVTRAYRGRMNQDIFASLMNDLLDQYIRASYLEGLAEGGIEADEIDDADEHAISDMEDAQADYVDGFAAAVLEAKSDSDLREQIDARIVMWAKSIRAAAVAGVNSAAANQVVIFSGESGKESCPECMSLLGERHRRSWFVNQGLVPGIPGNENFTCRGFNCEHQLSPVGSPVKARE